MPSSVVRDFEYDQELQELEITFVSGKIYVYSRVPYEVYLDFAAAKSKGKFFNQHIRDCYAYAEVSGLLN